MIPMWTAGNGYATSRCTNVPVRLGMERPLKSALRHPLQLCNLTNPPWNAATWKRFVSSHPKIALNHSTGIPLQAGRVTTGSSSPADHARESAPSGRWEVWPLSWKPGKPSESASVLHPPQIHIRFGLAWTVSPGTFEPTYILGPHLTLLQHPPSIGQPVLPSHRERLPSQECCVAYPLLLSVQTSPLYSSLETHRKIRLTTETDTPKKLSNTYSANDVFRQTTESPYYSPSQLEVHKMKSWTLFISCHFLKVRNANWYILKNFPLDKHRHVHVCFLSFQKMYFSATWFST